jgi:hypothetical protein
MAAARAPADSGATKQSDDNHWNYHGNVQQRLPRGVYPESLPQGSQEQANNIATNSATTSY